MSEIFADLHNHTTRSDGTTKPDDVVDVAKNSGLSAIALTDHDVTQEFDHPLVVRDGIDMISGIELRVEPEFLDERVDVLGYGVVDNSRLSSVLDRLRENRRVRANAMIDLIEEETGVHVEFEPTRKTGRPDIARAISQTEELSYGYEEAFQELIGRDCPCYVSRDVPSFEFGIEVLSDACMYTSLAHPYRYQNTSEALKLCENLDAVESIYPYGRETGNLDSLAANWFELGETGGSDSHNPEDMGKEGLTKEQYTAFLEDSNLDYYSSHV